MMSLPLQLELRVSVEGAKQAVVWSQASHSRSESTLEWPPMAVDPNDPTNFIFCDHFYHRHDFCMEQEAGLAQEYSIRCSKIREIKQSLMKKVFLDQAGRLQTRYVTFQPFSVRAEPSKAYPWGATAMLSKGMTLTQIGHPNSEWTKRRK
eukprot:CAMPEP_0206614628 /NCGR_PEP_ID=MMETSP0325_2-20121206/57535_1 /ASSEMBLY_ACC=CAM_ASM_000347 /TAXON_ID=2866 /ORGANISM="Crypthecodinium cohnii, Strain Seligo" /LENGTH=149 /DNA_ID=CAMNT_0054135221 /DNA_START=61 /DNA_END=508 /DNA_ORIENTATION=-